MLSTAVLLISSGLDNHRVIEQVAQVCAQRLLTGHLQLLLQHIVAFFSGLLGHLGRVVGSMLKLLLFSRQWKEAAPAMHKTIRGVRGDVLVTVNLCQISGGADLQCVGFAWHRR